MRKRARKTVAWTLRYYTNRNGAHCFPVISLEKSVVYLKKLRASIKNEMACSYFSKSTSNGKPSPEIVTMPKYFAKSVHSFTTVLQWPVCLVITKSYDMLASPKKDLTRELKAFTAVPVPLLGLANTRTLGDAGGPSVFKVFTWCERGPWIRE